MDFGADNRALGKIGGALASAGSPNSYSGNRMRDFCLGEGILEVLVAENIDAHVLATDISPVCIDFNLHRDQEIIMNVASSSPNGGRLEYQTLNIVEQHPELNQSFDIILDKGCLDTFAFRSRQRGQNQLYAPLIRTVLHNIHSWLRKDGVYWALTPRQKIKSVRDFRGFRSVQRVDLTMMQRGELVAIHQHTFLHVCSRNKEYSPSSTENAFDAEDDDLIEDTSSCSKCSVTFYDFRKGELVEGRGNLFGYGSGKATVGTARD